MDSQATPAADANTSVMCQLVSPEGDHLGAALYLPQNVGPPQLQEIVNHLLHNVCFRFAQYSLSPPLLYPAYLNPDIILLMLSGGQVALCILHWR